jgi:hypothetical protein
MAGNPLLNELLGGSFTWPNAAINEMGPLPRAPTGNLRTPDNNINPPDQTKLLQGGLADYVYSYGPNPARITTQTQNAIPNKVQRIIPQMFIPASQAESTAQQDPKLEHHVTDGDLVFSIKMNPRMVNDSQRYVIFPAGYSHKAVKLINLATLNYMLWGLQVGARMPAGSQWVRYFSELCSTDIDYLFRRLQRGEAEEEEEDEPSIQQLIWNFIRTVFAPFGVQHGFDTQGGQHEGSSTRVVTNAVDYVSSFAIEGKLIKVNNLWKSCDVYEDDDLVLALRYMPPRGIPITFNLCGSNRAHRVERCPMTAGGCWFLQPEVLAFKSLVDTPHVHIGRSQKMITCYSRCPEALYTNARAPIGGDPLQMTFEPCYVDSDVMTLKKFIGVMRRPVAVQQQRPLMAAPAAQPAPAAAAVRVTGVNLANALAQQQQRAPAPEPAVGDKRPPSAAAPPAEAPPKTAASTAFTAAIMGGPAAKKGRGSSSRAVSSKAAARDSEEDSD